MKKKLGFCTVLMTFSTFLLGFFALNNNGLFHKAEAAKEVDSGIFGVQMRSGGDSLNYLVINDTTIDIAQGHMSKSGDAYNAPSYINIYLASDADAIPLSAIIDNSKVWDINLWTSQGVMFPIANETYNTYNGTTVYAIEVLQGCKYPNNKSQTCVVQQTKKYYNTHYGEAAVRDFAVDWTETAPIEPSIDTITLTGGQVRADAENGFYYICLTSSYYTGVTVVEYLDLSTINAYNKIKVFFSATDTGTYLADVTALRKGCQNLWGSSSFHFQLNPAEFEIYNGKDLYKMEIEEGCQILLNNKVVTILTPYTFINQNYGDESYKYGAFYFLPEKAPITGPISLIDAQVRADAPDNFYFITLCAMEYQDTPVIHYDDLSALNTYSHIKIYLSENGEGILLSKVTTLRSGYQNLWSSNAMLFALNPGEYENTYNGTTIYAIEVLAGCELYISNQVVTVDKGYRFINSEYGLASAKYEAFKFNVEAVVVKLGEIGVQNVHNRMDPDSGYRWMMLFLDDSIYNVSVSFNLLVKQLNFLDNVFIYLSDSDDYLTLRDIYNPNATGVTLQLFNQKNMLAISISNEMGGEHYRYCGPEMYKIIINSGTEIPTYENGVYGYRVTNSKAVFINDDYHLYGDIPETMADDGNPRVYEEWNVNWGLVNCYVTFAVVGIDGLTFPDMLLERGQTISLERFEQDGYDLVVTTTSGDRVYKNIIGTNYNIDFVLTYSPAKGRGMPINMVPIIVGAAAGGAVLIAGAVVLLIVLKKRRGR